MLAPRRLLPSISSLLALEAVDRLGSATAAATELSLTQSAISRQLKALEDQMGVPMVARENMRLRLTEPAQTYVAQARASLNALAQAGVTLTANPDGGDLNLSILPAFGMHWLAPRLADFSRQHPEVTVNLSTRLGIFDFASAPFQAAIHFGARDWPGVDYLPIMDEDVVAVAAPGLADVTQPVDLLRLPLLHLESRPKAWGRWFAGQGIDAPIPTGMRFDQFATVLQGALHGLGVGLLPRFLARDAIDDGRLVELIPGASGPVGRYYLVWPDDRPMGQPLQKFRAWLAGQIDV